MDAEEEIILRNSQHRIRTPSACRTLAVMNMFWFGSPRHIKSLSNKVDESTAIAFSEINAISVFMAKYFPVCSMCPAKM